MLSATSKVQGHQHAHRVLVVDDSVDSAETLAMLLRLEAYETAIAFDGNSAIGIATRFQPEILLLDIGLPGMNGYELAAYLRRQPKTRDALMIALTGYGQSEYRQRSLQAGFDKHLTKPVDIEQLRTIMTQFVAAKDRTRRAP